MPTDDRSSSYQLLNLVKAFVKNEDVAPNEDFHDFLSSRNAVLINPSPFTVNPMTPKDMYVRLERGWTCFEG
jgi:hypothetical protein